MVGELSSRSWQGIELPPTLQNNPLTPPQNLTPGSLSSFSTLFTVSREQSRPLWTASTGHNCLLLPPPSSLTTCHSETDKKFHCCQNIFLLDRPAWNVMMICSKRHRWWFGDRNGSHVRDGVCQSSAASTQGAKWWVAPVPPSTLPPPL